MRSYWPIIKQAFSEWMSDNAFRLSASLSYYTVLSLAPLVTISVSLAGLIFGRDAVAGRLVEQMRGVVGEEGAQVVETVLANAADSGTGWAAAIGAVVLLIGASAVFAELQGAINLIWGVRRKPGAGFVTFVKTRLLTAGMVAVVGFLLLVSLVVSTALNAMSASLTGTLTLPAFVLNVIDLAVSFAVITLLFALVYRVLPDVVIAWRDVWLGAAVTAVLFTLGKYLIGLYVGRVGVGSSYGAAGSLIVLLVWVYYSSLILFLGAEFTQVHAQHRGKGLEPKAYAYIDDGHSHARPTRRAR